MAPARELRVRHDRRKELRTRLKQPDVLCVEAPRLHRLDDEDADRDALDDERRSEQRLEALLARLGEVSEVRVAARVLDRHGLAALRGPAHEAFAEAERHVTHRTGVEPPRRAQRDVPEVRVGQVDGAHVGIEALRHQLDDVRKCLFEIVRTRDDLRDVRQKRDAVRNDGLRRWARPPQDQSSW